MRLGVIDFSEKHANIGTLFWATVYSIGSTIKQGFSFHEKLGIVTRGDFYGQDYVLIAKGANMSIVWDWARGVSISGIKHRFGAPAKLQFNWRRHLTIII